MSRSDEVRRLQGDPSGEITAVMVSREKPHVRPSEHRALMAYLRTGSVKAAAHALGRAEGTIREELYELRKRLGVVNVTQATWIALGAEAVADVAKEYRDAEWNLRILDGEGCNRLDPRWNAAVDRWRAADAALAAVLGESSPFRRHHDPANEGPCDCDTCLETAAEDA